MNQEEIQNIFQPIIDLFVWGAEQGYGSFLSFEFGTAKLEFSKIIQSDKDRIFPFDKFESRRVTIKGEHTFFVYMSNWKILANTNELAFDESERDEIEFALQFINGQKLQNIHIDPTQNITELSFDLGGIIRITNETYDDELNEMWNFYTKADNVLTYRNDRKLAFEKSDLKYGTEKFKELKEKITCPNKT